MALLCVYDHDPSLNKGCSISTFRRYEVAYGSKVCPKVCPPLFCRGQKWKYVNFETLVFLLTLTRDHAWHSYRKPFVRTF